MGEGGPGIWDPVGDGPGLSPAAEGSRQEGLAPGPVFWSVAGHGTDPAVTWIRGAAWPRCCEGLGGAVAAVR